MPGNTKKRKRKHRGTQTGKVDRRGRTSRPRSRKEAMAQARKQPTDRRSVPPSWRGATMRGLFFAALLLPVSILFGQPIGGAIILAVFAAAFYIPLGFYTDRFFYRRRMAKAQREREAKKAESAAKKAGGGTEQEGDGG